MGDVIVLAERRRMREENGNGGATAAVVDGPAHSAIFLFDLASPLTYLAAERVERLLGTVRWQPVAAEALHRIASQRGLRSSTVDVPPGAPLARFAAASLFGTFTATYLALGRGIDPSEARPGELAH